MSRYKYCCVPECESSTTRTPEKLFVSVPGQNPDRKKWFDAMRRDTKVQPVSEKTVFFVCEDHFDLENDATNLNYVKMFRQQGEKVRLNLKAGTLPSKFECQKSRLITEKKTVTKRDSLALKKRKREQQQLVAELISSTDEGVPGCSYIPEEPMEIVEELVPLPTHQEIGVQVQPETQEKATMARPHFRAYGVQVRMPNVNVVSTHTSPFKECLPSARHDVKTVIIHDSDGEEEEEESSSSDFPSLTSAMTSTTMSSSDSVKKAEFKAHLEMCLKITLKNMELKPRLFLGIPEECYFLINLLADTIKCADRDIMITLKKLRCNHPFSMLSVDFGMSQMNVSRIFNKTLPLINAEVRKLIYWPCKERIFLKLPIPFRKNYRKVVAIIDCFEIQIEKPSNPYHQALTWSQYYNCNTIKYLIACTPNGFVSFISSGFGGRISDKEIVNASGFTNYLTAEDHVLADRGFKNLGDLFQQHKATLVRPPSLPAGSQFDKSAAKTGKEIASLRVHVERVIGRLREFKLLTPHSTVDSKLLPLLDLSVETICGLVNTYSLLI